MILLDGESESYFVLTGIGDDVRFFLRDIFSGSDAGAELGIGIYELSAAVVAYDFLCDPLLTELRGKREVVYIAYVFYPCPDTEPRPVGI